MPIVLAGRNFDLGYRSDRPRDQLGQGMAFRLKDWIPDLDAALRKRGGWSLASADLNSLGSSADVTSLGWTYFAGDPHLIEAGDNGQVYSDRNFDGSGTSLIGNTGFGPMTHEPIWSNDGNLAVLLQGLGLTAKAPQKYYLVSPGVYGVAALGGSPPLASVGASWTDYLLLANGSVGGTRFPNRIWISPVGAPESAWQTGTAFQDMESEVIKIIALYNIILVFGYTDVWAISGDTPPPNSNWSTKTVFRGNGAMDGRTVTAYQNYVIWANSTGVYRSDGFTLSDMTARAGVKQRWQELVGSFNFSTGWSAAAGVYRNTYVITVYDQAGNFVTCQCFDIVDETCYEMTNIAARMFSQRFAGPGTATFGGAEELFFGHRTLPRVGKMSTCWMPSAAVANDGDGTAVLPVLETPFYKIGGSGKKRIRRAYITYDLRTSGGAAALAADYVLTPDEGAPYTALSGSLPLTTKDTRSRLEIRQRGIGVALRLRQTAASADTRIADIELELNPYEQVR